MARDPVKNSGPVLLVVRGLSGCGKSTLASHLARILGAELLQTDITRRHQFGSSTLPDPYNTGRYNPENRDLVYDQMFRQSGSRYLVSNRPGRSARLVRGIDRQAPRRG